MEHISAYHLIYEEDTPIYNMLKQHQISEVDEDSSLDFFHVTDRASAEKRDLNIMKFRISAVRASTLVTTVPTGKEYLIWGADRRHIPLTG